MVTLDRGTRFGDLPGVDYLVLSSGSTGTHAPGQIAGRHANASDLRAMRCVGPPLRGRGCPPISGVQNTVGADEIRALDRQRPDGRPGPVRTVTDGSERR